MLPTAKQIIEGTKPVADDDFIGQMLKSCDIMYQLGSYGSLVRPVSAYMFLDAGLDSISPEADLDDSEPFYILEPGDAETFLNYEDEKYDPFKNGTAVTELGGNICFIGGVEVEINGYDIASSLNALKSAGYSDAVKRVSSDPRLYEVERFIVIDRFEIDLEYQGRGVTAFILSEIKEMFRTNLTVLDPILTDHVE